MTIELDNLQPRTVWAHFATLCAITRWMRFLAQ
jgi:hypothetical protein